MGCDAKMDEVVNSEEECPLFMEGLPKDFSSHFGLAAIASFLSEEDDVMNKNKSKTTSNSIRRGDKRVGGGKSKRIKIHRSRQEPYYFRRRSNRNTEAELQVYLNLWKI